MYKRVRKIQIVFCVVLLSFACAKDQKQVEEVERIVEVEVEKQVIKDIPTQPVQQVLLSEVQANGSPMFTDADEQEVAGKKILYNDEFRSFRVNQMLEVKVVKNTCRIRNFLPYTFRNIELLMNARGFKAPIKIAQIEEFPALYEYSFDLPFSEGEVFFENIHGDKVSLQNFTNINPAEVQFSFVGTDPMLDKLKTIKLNTLYCFRPYNQSGWDRLTVEDARNYLPIVVNMAYMFSSDEFEKKVHDYPYDFRNNDNVLDRAKVVRSFRDIARQDLGIVSEPGVGGLGGGSTFGVRREYLKNPNSAFYKESNLKQPWFSSVVMNVWIHEFGHVAGYGHNGNMTYFEGPNDNAKGMVPLGMALYQKMLLSKELPFSEYPY